MFSRFNHFETSPLISFALCARQSLYIARIRILQLARDPNASRFLSKMSIAMYSVGDSVRPMFEFVGELSRLLEKDRRGVPDAFGDQSGLNREEWSCEMPASSSASSSTRM